MMKNTPGPRAPPVTNLPSLKMTALSYSWTTFTTKKRERGREMRMRRTEVRVIMWEQRPGPWLQSVAGGGRGVWSVVLSSRDLRTERGLSSHSFRDRRGVIPGWGLMLDWSHLTGDSPPHQGPQSAGRETLRSFVWKFLIYFLQVFRDPEWGVEWPRGKTWIDLSWKCDQQIILTWTLQILISQDIKKKQQLYSPLRFYIFTSSLYWSFLWSALMHSEC